MTASKPSNSSSTKGRPGSSRIGPSSGRKGRSGTGRSGTVPRPGKSGKTRPLRGGKTQQIKVGKSGKTKRGRGRKDRDPSAGAELAPIPQPRIGFPIWIKFAIPTAIIVSAFMVLLGVLISQRTVADLEDQINRRGVALTNFLAASAPEHFWVEFLPPNFDPEDKDTIPKEQKEREINLIRDKLAQQWNDKLNLIAQNSKNQTGERDIRALLLIDYDKSQTQGKLKAGSEANNVKLETDGDPIPIGDVRVFKGTLGGIAVREFRKPIYVNGKPVEDCLNPGNYGWVSVFLESQSIEEVGKKTIQNILIITLLAVVGSVIVIVMIATIFTRPIRVLQDDIARVAGGNLDHKTIPQSNDEIGALAQVFAVMVKNLRSAQAHEADRKAIERELSIANEIQTKLLPDRLPQIPGFDIHRFYESAKEVGGDYYDFLVIDQRHLGLVVADVSGKGIPGSMVMTMVRSLLRLASVRNFSPADTFKKVNRILAKDIRRGMFVTAIYMVFDIVDKKLKVASAGHNPLIVYRAETKTVELVKPKGIALGFDKGPTFDKSIKELEIQLNPGDRIVAYTDGVNEAMNIDEEEFGDEALYKLVQRHAAESSEEFINKLVAAVKEHQGEAEQSDDITIATLAVR